MELSRWIRTAGSRQSIPRSTESGLEGISGIETAPLAEQARLNARALVAKTIEAGEWPGLLEQIAGWCGSGKKYQKCHLGK